MAPVRRLLALVLALAAAPAVAGDGVVEINQTCADSPTGCFCGDAQYLPVTITGCAGRSYRLTSDLHLGSPVVSGIVVSAPNVTLDLGGFAIRGLNVCNGTSGGCAYAGTGFGIEVAAGNEGPTDRVQISNGSVVGVGGVGLFAPIGEGHVIRNVRAAHNGFQGIRVDSAAALVEGVVATRNGSSGISVGPRARVASCTAHDNGEYGIRGGDGANVSGSTASSNGWTGILVEAGGAVTDCTARENGVNGIQIAALSLVRGGLVSRCVATQNQGAGIELNGRGALAVENSITDNRGEGLRFDLQGSAYRANVIADNDGAAVSGTGFVNLGDNACASALGVVVPCP